MIDEQGLLQYAFNEHAQNCQRAKATIESMNKGVSELEDLLTRQHQLITQLLEFIHKTSHFTVHNVY